MSTLLAGGVALALLTAPNANLAECGHAADGYAAAVAKVMGAARAYENCVAKSAMHDDCATEMQALDDAHDNFVDAVSTAKECR